MNRRKTLAATTALWLGVSHFSSASGRTPAPTPSQTEGPYYPVEPIALRNDLTFRNNIRAAGKRLLLSGVVSRAGAPLAGVRVEIWQCDAQARYRHPASDLAGFDPGFEGYGAQITDAAGAYSFITIEPVAYPGRPPHIHMRVKGADKVLLTTQAYPPADSQGNPPPGIFSTRGGDPRSLLLKPLPPEQNMARAQFDIILA